jgi:hypothetical protein
MHAKDMGKIEEKKHKGVDILLLLAVIADQDLICSKINGHMKGFCLLIGLVNQIDF